MTRRFWNIVFIVVGGLPLVLIGMHYLFLLIDQGPLMPGLLDWTLMLAGLVMVVLGFGLLRKGSRADRAAGVAAFILLVLIVGWSEFRIVFP